MVVTVKGKVPLACGMTSSAARAMSMKYVKRVKLTKGWKEAGDEKMKKSAPIMSTLKTSERTKIFISEQTMMTIHSRDEVKGLVIHTVSYFSDLPLIFYHKEVVSHVRQKEKCPAE